MDNLIFNVYKIIKHTKNKHKPKSSSQRKPRKTMKTSDQPTTTGLIVAGKSSLSNKETWSCFIPPYKHFAGTAGKGLKVSIPSYLDHGAAPVGY